MQDIRTRTNSLTPPYPTFAEFIRDLMASGKTARDISTMIRHPDGSPVEEGTVHRWASGTPMSNNLRALIEEKLGYRLVERTFFESAERVGFPPEDAPEEIRMIVNDAGLRIYLSRLITETTNIAALTRFFGFSARSLLTTYLGNDAKYLSGESMDALLSRLPVLPRHLSGELISATTPVATVGKICLDCRLQSGESHPDYAKRLDITADYGRYLEQIAGQKKRTIATSDPQRLDELGRRLMAERRRLGMDRGHEAPASGLPGVPSPPHPPQAPRASESEATTYRSPFAAERWQTHDLRVDEQLIGTAESLMRATAELLGLLAGVKNDAARAAIRRRLAQPLIELFGAIEGFSKEFPDTSAVRNIIDAWRKFQKELKP